MFKIGPSTHGFGEGVILTKPVEKYQRIVLEEPIVTATFSASHNYVCGFCLKESADLSACAGCKWNFYCSVECQKKDWQLIHKEECKVLCKLSKENETGKPIKPTANFIALLRMFLLSKKGELKGVEPLYWNKDQLPKEQIDYFEESAALVLKLTENKFDLEQISFMMEIQMKFALNAFSIPFEDSFSVLSKCKAVSLFETTSKVNHSCDPNSLAVFEGRDQKIYTRSKLEEGTEITISYIDTHLPQTSRDSLLKSRYFFQCGCSACKNPEKYKEIEDQKTKIKCNYCQKATKQTPESTASSVFCSECGKEVDKPSEKLGEFNFLQKELFLLAESKLLAEGKYEILDKLVKSLIRKLIFWHGEDYPEVGWYYYKRAKLQSLASRNKPALKTGEKAIRNLSRFYNRSVQDLRSLIKNLEFELHIMAPS